jgi:hypothetical protein
MTTCVECGSVGDFWFFKLNDTYGTEIKFCYCDFCGVFWKTLNGSLLDGSITYKFLDTTWLGFDINDMINTSIYKDNVEIRGILKECLNSNMLDHFHRCLHCNEIISGTLNENGCYECTQCGFEWGVVKIA